MTVPLWGWVLFGAWAIGYSIWVGWSEDNKSNNKWANRSHKAQIFLAFAFGTIALWFIYTSIALR